MATLTNIVFTRDYAGRGKSCSLHGSDTKRFRGAIGELDGARFFPKLKEFEAPGWTINMAKCAEVQELLRKINAGDIPETPEGAPTSAKARRTKKAPLPQVIVSGTGLPGVAPVSPSKTQTVTYTLPRPYVGQTATFTAGGAQHVRRVDTVETDRDVVIRVYLAQGPSETTNPMLYIGDGRWLLWGLAEQINVTFA